MTEDYDVPEVRLDYTGTANSYSGFDRFGRVVDQLWHDYGNTEDADRFKYGYDRVGNRLWKENDVAANLGTPVDLDELYDYDDLYQLDGTERGELTFDDPNPGDLAITDKVFAQDWTLDGLGNWAAFDDDGDEQTRDTNTANEITEITGGAVTPKYDAAGNMTSMPQPGSETDRLFAVYDGWNRLVKVYADDGDGTFEPTTGDDLMVTYEHDGLGRRIEKAVTADGGGARAVDYFYNESWQLLESQEVVGETTSVDQYIWDESYIDAPVVRYHDSDNDGTYEDPNDYVHYHTWDANQNVTAAIDEDGTVVERYVYTPYGEATVYAADWTNPTAPTADGPLYAGYFFDAETGLYHVRNRQYHPTLGNFVQRDPIGYAAGDVNLYRYVGNGPIGLTDPTGEQQQGTELTLGEYVRWRYEVLEAAAMKLAELERAKTQAMYEMGDMDVSRKVRNRAVNIYFDTDGRIKKALGEFDDRYFVCARELKFDHDFREEFKEYANDIKKIEQQIQDLKNAISSSSAPDLGRRQRIEKLKRLEKDLALRRYSDAAWRLFKKAAGYGDVESRLPRESRGGFIRLDLQSRSPLKLDRELLGHDLEKLRKTLEEVLNTPGAMQPSQPSERDPRTRPPSAEKQLRDMAKDLGLGTLKGEWDKKEGGIFADVSKVVRLARERKLKIIPDILQHPFTKKLGTEYSKMEQRELAEKYRKWYGPASAVVGKTPAGKAGPSSGIGIKLKFPKIETNDARYGGTTLLFRFEVYYKE